MEKKHSLVEIEKLEHYYLNKYYFFLRFAEEELLFGFKTKDKIKSDWRDKYDDKISSFYCGAERIVYSMMNGKGIGQPNSSPVGSDMFFEVENAYIHIDLKTVGASLEGKTNIGDYTKSIFIGTNQTSYREKIITKDYSEGRQYEPALPTYYTDGKICLTYFITILYDKDTTDIQVISLVCMPNGELSKHYGNRVLQAGKIHSEARFRFTDVSLFELYDKSKRRIKVVYFNEDMDSRYMEKLKFFRDIWNKQKESE